MKKFYSACSREITFRKKQAYDLRKKLSEEKDPHRRVFYEKNIEGLVKASEESLWYLEVLGAFDCDFAITPGQRDSLKHEYTKFVSRNRKKAFDNKRRCA